MMDQVPLLPYISVPLKTRTGFCNRGKEGLDGGKLGSNR